MAKRLFDIVASAIGLVVLSPVLLALAAWIALDSPGPVFYRGVRGGLHNKPFRIFKFRTMVLNAEAIGGASSADHDPRITSPGRLIRRYKLDELPQLLNVFKGDMSIVGPRPQILSYTTAYSGELADIMSVRPGMTDWASIWNADEGAVLAGAADPDHAYDVLINPTKLKLQLHYVRTRSFAEDVRIILATIRRVLDPGYYPAELNDVPRLAKGAGAAIPSQTAS
ncbi:MAG TPA: sugar transferase [Gemmatimonadaceae bacterium]|nr:sugar transferase [Gemmatimonadaceae bacterium]